MEAKGGPAAEGFKCFGGEGVLGPPTTDGPQEIGFREEDEDKGDAEGVGADGVVKGKTGWMGAERGEEEKVG